MTLTDKIAQISALTADLTRESEHPIAERVVLCQAVLSSAIVDACVLSGQGPEAALRMTARAIEEAVMKALSAHSIN